MSSPEFSTPEKETYQRYVGLASTALLFGKSSAGEERYWFHLDYVNGDISRSENVVLKCEVTDEIKNGIKIGAEVLVLGKPIKSFRRQSNGRKSGRRYLQAYEIEFP